MKKIGTEQIPIKKITRAKVLKVIKNEGPISRIEIATRLGLTKAAISIIIDDFIAEGLVSEIGSKLRDNKTSQGRRKILVDINANYKFAFGIFATADCISMGFSTLCGDSLDKVNIKLNEIDLSIDGFVNYVKNCFDNLLKSNYLEHDKIIGIGVGCDSGFARSIGIDAQNCQDIIAQALYEKIHLPVCVENANLTLALANIYFPSNRSESPIHSAVFLQCSESFGMLEFSESDSSDNTNINWTCLDNYIINFNGRKSNESIQGSLATEISHDAVRKKIAEQCPELNSEIIEMIMQGYGSDNVQKAIDIKNECVQMFAVFLYNLLQTKNVQKIILHKFHFSDFDYVYLLKYIEINFPASNAASVISRSRINDSYSFLGGCAIALREFFIESGGLDLKI